MGDEEFLERALSQQDGVAHEDLERMRSKIVDHIEEIGTILRPSLDSLPVADEVYFMQVDDREFTELLIELPLPEGEYTFLVEGRICNSKPNSLGLFCYITYPGMSIPYNSLVEASPNPASPIGGFYTFSHNALAHFAGEGANSISVALASFAEWWYAAPGGSPQWELGGESWWRTLRVSPLSITAKRY
jgi:hypothetical protein